MSLAFSEMLFGATASTSFFVELELEASNLYFTYNSD